MFKALYRKYRPKNFDDVVGQNHVISVLKNAIEMDKIAHAYIFYGPRGTGKTSIAKIFANEVNKNENYQSDSVDIIEIDAASNNGVDEIREIKEAIKFAPNEGKYKVYIIDEVHMLTISAFNALLKTLEEPPAHIIFILATTEMHKIPATILSRCQKFEFKNISREELVGRLKYIAQIENIDIDDEAAKKIALIAKGGLRDAIGILDQVSNYNMGKVRLEDVLDITSAVGEEQIISLYELLLDGDSSGALVKYTEFLEAAKDTKLLLNDLINISRDMIIYKNTRNLDFCEYNLESITEKLEVIESDRLYKNIEYLAEAEASIRFSTEYISYMQVCLIKMSSFSSPVQQSVLESTSVGEGAGLIKRLEERIARLEEKLEKVNSLDTTNIVTTKLVEKDVQSKEESATTKSLAENSTSKKRAKFESVKPDKLIIPNKERIKEVITQSNEKFTTYASSVFARILQEAIGSHGDIYDLFHDATLAYSSKEAAVLIFKDPQSLFKLGSNDDYASYIENRFQKFLGVKYKIFALQEEQHQVLMNLIKNESEDAEEVKIEKVESEEIKKTSKIESLFQDIIVEE